MEVTPRYVFCDGDYIEVSAFKHLPRNQRPEVFCPQCKDGVILKLGDKVEHHFAHKKHSSCYWTPETATHFDAKIDLAKALKQAGTIRPTVRCPDCNQYKLPTEDFITGWNRVEVEYQMGLYRPDIALLRDNDFVAAVEIYVSSEVSADKANHFDEIGIQWIELAVSRTTQPWRVDAQNVLVNAARVGGMRMEREICPTCQKRAEAAARAEQFRIMQRAVYQQRSAASVKRYTFVDVFYPVGAYLRYVVWITTEFVPYRMTLQWHQGIIKQQSGGMSDEQAIDYLKNYIDQDPKMLRIIEKGGHVVLHEQIEQLAEDRDLLEQADEHPVAYLWVDGSWQPNPEIPIISG